MKHEPRDESHRLLGRVVPQEAQRHDGEDGKEKREKMKTRAEIRNEGGREEVEDNEGSGEIVGHLQDINHRVVSCRLP